MKVIVAKTAGFCMGVKRAVDIALEQASQARDGIKTIGPLIHNKQTLEMLRQRGVVELTEDTVLGQDAKMLVRAHGIPPELQQKFTDEGHVIIDGTCPKVKTVHKVIERHYKMGYTIVITGDEGHPEVIGLLGYAGEKGILIDKADDVATLPDTDKICLVSQTTFDRLLFDDIANKIRERFSGKEIVVKKTICAATDQRQAEVAELAKQVDALIVVGGKNSANTQRLAKIATECGTPTQCVETEQEIEWDKIADCQTVGVTAGASTPNWMIKRVSDYIGFMARTRKNSIPNLSRRFFDYLTNINLFVALGAVSVYYTSSFLQDVPFSWGGAAISFFYFLSMYLWNSMASIETMQHHGISRYRFYHDFKPMLFVLSGVSVTILLITSFAISRELGFLMLFATVAGSVYHSTFLPVKIQEFLRFKTLKDIPSSRDLFVAIAWATLLTALPLLINHSNISYPIAPATFSWIFILAFLRSLIFDLRDIEGDRIMGRETLITIVGEKRARKYLQILIVTCFFALLFFPMTMGIGAYSKLNTMLFLFQIPVLLYIFAFVKINQRLGQSRNTIFTLFADGLFYLAGFGAFLASFLIGNG